MDEQVMTAKQADRIKIMDIIAELDKLPNVNNDPASIKKMISALNTLLHIKGTTPPFSEIMTWLKHEKPNLFYSTRNHLTTTSHLRTLFQIDMELEVAKQRLKSYAHPNVFANE